MKKDDERGELLEDLESIIMTGKRCRSISDSVAWATCRQGAAEERCCQVRRQTRNRQMDPMAGPRAGTRVHPKLFHPNYSQSILPFEGKAIAAQVERPVLTQRSSFVFNFEAPRPLQPRMLINQFRID